MFDTLPRAIQQQIRIYLEKGNFLAAKALYDQWAKIPADKQQKLA